MSQTFKRITTEQVNKAIEDVLFDELKALLAIRGNGHCMRVSDLDVSVMQSLCKRLREKDSGAQAFLLSNESARDGDHLITGSKLVEIRNPLPDGGLRPPLLVFVPNELKVASEDSFGVATFEQVYCGGVYNTLENRISDGLPDEIRAAIKQILAILKHHNWRWADRLAVTRFLLSVGANGSDAEVVGASLFELALIPDFKLLDVPVTSPMRIERNLQCVELLTTSPKSERGRVMDLGLKDTDFKRKLGNFLVDSELEDPYSWTRQIVLDEDNWGLSFDKWEFESSGSGAQQVCVEVTSIDLPMVKTDEQDPRLKPLVNQQVLTLGQGGLKKLSVNFEVSPTPGVVPGLDHFKVEVVSKVSGPIGLVKKKSIWKTKRADATVSISNLTKVDWEEGWHYLRVTAHTEDGDSIQLIDTVGNALPWGTGTIEEPRRLNESAEFYVFKGDDFDIEPTQRAVPRYSSLMHAYIEKQFSAITDGREPGDVSITKVAWLDERAAPELRGNDFVEVKLGRDGTCHVPVSKVLKQLEQKILSSPRGAISRRVTISNGVAADPIDDMGNWPPGEEVERFLVSRSRYFQEVLASDAMLVMEAVDCNRLRAFVTEYAESYLNALQCCLRRAESNEGLERQNALQELQTLLSVDQIKVDHLSHRGQASLSVMLGPTHPLRALWLVSWAALSGEWLEKSKTTLKEFVKTTGDSLSQRLSLVNFPAVLAIDQGHLLIAVDNIHPFWTLYAPANEPHPRGLISEVCTALSLEEPNVGSFTLDGEYLTRKIRRYLLQHPYVESLAINVFNAGRGRLLLQTLLELQRDPDFSELRYNIRLFVPDPDASGVGEDVAELLSTSGQTLAEEADAFALPTGNHLSPKLSLAFLSTDDFRNSPASYAAHISILLDVFPAQEILAQTPALADRGAPVHALLQDFAVHYNEGTDSISWTRQPRHGLPTPIQGAEELSDLLARLAEVLSNGAASVATSEVGMNLLPASRLVLGPDDRALLHQVHEISDWVFTVDRNVGVEFFDHGEHVQRPEYLIDHSPDVIGGAGRRVVITSRSLTEVEAMMTRVLGEHGFAKESRRGAAVLRELRALSGRLALKLLSAPTQRSEVLGLALAKMFLEYQEVFKNQIVVPLDDHLDLYQEFGAGLEGISDEISLRRTDLALLDLDASRRTITCNLIEVKCYRRLGGVGPYNQLKDSIVEQIRQSEKVLQFHFDPASTPRDRPDRLLKVQELASLLEYYANRGARLQLLSPDAKDEAIFLLRTLESGYTLKFTRSALIFDFEKTGTEEAIHEQGIEFHRIGVDLISTLLQSLPEREADESTVGSGTMGTAQREDVVPALKDASVTTSIPKLTRAVFIPGKRNRTVSWDLLGSTSTSTTTDEGFGGPPAPLPAPPQTPALPTAATPSPSVEENTAVSHERINGVAETVDVVPLKKTIECEQQISESPLPEYSDHAAYDIMLGVTESSPQYGLLGQIHGRKVALDLNQTHTISLFGVQGGGKSYTLGTIIEMATMGIPGINSLPSPLATVIFHYSSTQDYEPEFTAMNRPNAEAKAVELLAKDFGARPTAIRDVVLLAPRDKVRERQEQYSTIPVHPLTFASSELQASHWKFLMGAVGSQATYIRQLNQLMRTMRQDLTLQGLRHAVEQCSLPDNLKALAGSRLNLAAEYIDDSTRLGDLIVPGRLVIVDLRDEFIEKDEALGLFVVLLQIFADAKYQGKKFNKLVVFDEAHKYIDSPDLVDGLISVVREMRHKGTSVLVASQDPPSVPIALIELSSQIILHRFNSPAWLKHIQKANAALSGLSAEQMARLSTGEAYVWSSKSTDPVFSREAVRIQCRPRVTAHGGSTKTAV